MGFFSGLRAIKKMAKIKAGGRERLCIADITYLIVNLQDAKQNLPDDQFSAVHSLFQALQKCHTYMDLDLAGYFEEAIEIIGLFNQIAPYEKYSGMEKTEALFFMNEVKPFLDTQKSKSEALLNGIISDNPELKKYFSSKEKDIEELLTEIVNRQRTEEDDEYINYLIQNCHFLNREHATAFYGVIVANYLYGKEKALELMDQLFIKWINSETIDNVNKPPVITFEICFCCGVLVPNGIITKEESDELSNTYSDLWTQHVMKLVKK